MSQEPLPIARLGIAEPQPGEAEIRQLRAIYWALRRNLRWIFACAFLGMLSAYLLSYLIDDRYTSVARVMLDTRITVDPEYTPQVSGLPTTLTSLQSEIEVLRSTDLIVGVIDSLSLADHPEFNQADNGTLSPLAFLRASVKSALAGLRPQVPEEMVPSADSQHLSRLDDIIEAVRSARAINQVGNTSAVYEIEVTTRDPRLSADIANALVNQYLASQKRAKYTTLRESQGWLAERTRDLQQTLSELSAELEALIIERPFSPEEYATIQARRTVFTEELRVINSDLSALDGQPGFDEAKTALSLRLTELESELEELIASQERQARYLAQKGRIENEILVNEAIYKDFVEQLSRRTQQEDFLQPDARMIETARPDFDASEPRRSKMALLVGIVLCLLCAGAVVLREMFQSKLRTVQEITDTTGLDFLGIIPNVDGGQALTSLDDASAPIREDLMRFARKLCMSLDAFAVESAGSKKTEKGVMIAGISSTPAEGQSSAIAALAQSYAEAGMTVAVFDATGSIDFWPTGERTQLSEAFSLTNTTNPSIDLVRPEEGGSVHQGMPKGYLGSLKRKYDRILIDAPPLLETLDAVPLAKEADIQILFVRWNHTKKHQVAATLGLIEDTRMRPVGVVATRVDLKTSRLFGEPTFSFGNAT